MILCIEFPSAFPPDKTSKGFKAFLRGFDGVRHLKVLWILLVIRLVIRLLWLISSPILLIGNRLAKSSYFVWWQTFGLIIILLSAVTSAYFLIVHYECGFLGNIRAWSQSISSLTPTEEAGKEAAQFVLFLTLFDGGVIFFLPTVMFVSCVHMRSVDIQAQKREAKLLESWTASAYEMTPYRIPRAKVINPEKRQSAPPSASTSMTHVPSDNPGGGTARSHFYYDNEAFEPVNEGHHTLPTSLHQHPLQRSEPKSQMSHSNPVFL